MTVEKVRQFFADVENQQQLTERLHASDLDLDAAEAISVSSHSPAVVRDDERVARLLFSPHFVDPDTGIPKTAAFKDAATRGLSVDRLGLSTPDGTHARGLAHAEAKRAAKGGDAREPQYEGFVDADCRAVRLLLDQTGKRRFYVFDTAQADNRAHADICQARFAEKKETIAAREALMNVFNPIVRPQVR